jgi:hypothetical protein
MSDVPDQADWPWERERRGNPVNTYWTGRLGAAKLLVFRNNRRNRTATRTSTCSSPSRHRHSRSGRRSQPNAAGRRARRFTSGLTLQPSASSPRATVTRTSRSWPSALTSGRQTRCHGEAPRRQGVFYRVPFVLDDLEQRAGRSLWPASALLPTLHGVQVESEASGKLGLRHTELAPERLYVELVWHMDMSKAKLGDIVTKHSTHPGNPDLELHLAAAEEQDVLAPGIDLLLVKAPILLGQDRRR